MLTRCLLPEAKHMVCVALNMYEKLNATNSRMMLSSKGNVYKTIGRSSVRTAVAFVDYTQETNEKSFHTP